MSIILLPFKLIWALVSFIFEMTGRLVGMVLGAVLMIAGGILTATIIGAVAGIPMFIFGLLMVARTFSR